MSLSRNSRILALILVFGAMVVNGCATTGGSYNVTTPPKDASELQRFSELNVEIQCKEGISLTDNDKERILQLIMKHLQTQCSDRFKTINSQQPGSYTLQASVVIKRYDEGNAFARAMLAGLGQMHIDADVLLSNWETKETLATYEVTKTFAWGGIYGGVTRITDIEDGFAQAVVASISGQKE